MVTKVDSVNQKSNDDENVTSENQKNGVPKEVYVVAREIQMVKSLASIDPIQRSKQLKKLQKWLQIRCNSSIPFNNEDFCRLWKGLYYCMWMCDKPLNQENLCEDLCNLLKCFNNAEISIQFFNAFLKTMCLEWFGVDQWRMDKFMMLVRRMFRVMFQVMKSENWQNEHIISFNSQLSNALKSRNSTGLIMHIIDVYLEELGKIANGEIPKDVVVKLLQPFIVYIAVQKESKLLGYVRNRIFYHLLWQSDLGREYTDKFNAWEQMGFPTESINEIEKIDEDSEMLEPEEGKEEKFEENQKERILDPRAGNVDVFIPALPVDASRMIKRFEEILYTKLTNTKSRRFIRTILEKYKEFEMGNFPLGVKKMPKLKSDESFDKCVEKKVNELKNLEEELYGTTRTLKKLNKKKRRKLLSSLNFEELNEDNFEEAIKSSLEKSKKNRKRKSSDTWIEEEINLNNDKEEENKKIKSSKKSCLKESDGITIDTPNVENKLLTNKNSTDDSWIESDSMVILEKSDNNLEEKTEELKQKTQEKQKTIEWDEPLKEGEVEYFIPSKKSKLKKANNDLQMKNVEEENTENDLVLNPFAKIKSKKTKNVLLGKSERKIQKNQISQLQQQKTSVKKVKIVLQKNTIQKPSDYIQQVKMSPKLPFDADKMPTKGLLKPNLTPSPINPFYKKKIGLKLDGSFTN